MDGKKQIEERIELEHIISDAIRDYEDYCEYCYESGDYRVFDYEESIADSILSAGYRKQSEGCFYCEKGDEKCGTCVKFFDYYEDGCGERCSTEFDSKKCIAYKPMNYCSMCGRELKGD